MKLYLVRHGEAKLSLVDDQRVLSEKGIREVTNISYQLKEKNCHLNIIYHSGIQRAEETAKIIAQTISPVDGIYKMDGLEPMDDEQVICKVVSDFLTDSMLIGHLPFMSNLAYRLLSSNIDKKLITFSPATIVALEKKSDNWIWLWTMTPEIN